MEGVDAVVNTSRTLAALVGCAVLLCSCAPAPTTTTTSTTTTTTTTTEAPTTTTEAPTPLEQEAATVLMVGVRDYEDARYALSQGVGGIFIGSWTDPALITDPERNINALRAEFTYPFAVAIDAEGGRVVRQSNLFGQVPSPRVMADTMSPEQVRGTAYELGTKLRAAGITVDFAPVLDVDSGPADGAIGDRSFSGDPHVAATFATAFGAGLMDAGVTPVFKHFPGHGRASGDTHFAEVVTPPINALKDLDLTPYAQALQLPGAAVMVGHMIVPDYGDPNLPSTIDPAIYQLLRSGDYPGGAPFTGVVYTDDLSGMRAISDRMGPAEAATQAIASGADVALWVSTDQLQEAITSVVTATREGRIDEAHLRDAATRIRAER